MESGGDPNAIGDEGLAAGILQIQPICLVDVNRILGVHAFAFHDRMDKKASIEMCRVYLSHYATSNRLGRPPTLEDMARVWNGGPGGHRKQSTNKYWAKVKTEIERQQTEGLQ